MYVLLSLGFMDFFLSYLAIAMWLTFRSPLYHIIVLKTILFLSTPLNCLALSTNMAKLAGSLVLYFRLHESFQRNVPVGHILLKPTVLSIMDIYLVIFVSILYYLIRVHNNINFEFKVKSNLKQ